MAEQNLDSRLDKGEVWLRAWIAVATSNSCHSLNVATSWADKCLEKFEERFE